MYAAYTKNGRQKPVTFACRCAVWRILMQIYFFIPYSYLFVCAFFVYADICAFRMPYAVILPDDNHF